MDDAIRFVRHPRYLVGALGAVMLVVAGQSMPLQASEPNANQSENGAIKLEVVKYDQLIAAVKARRGQVVVVDVWGAFCIPCMREFPNLVRLHQRYAQKGLACISVTVDTINGQEAALAFLKRVGATFSNYLLDEDAQVWQAKWNLKSVPAVFVFDRQGKLVGKFDDDDPNKEFTYADVIQLVQTLMQQDP